jgi:hypothetical protein
MMGTVININGNDGDHILIHYLYMILYVSNINKFDENNDGNNN